MVAAVVKVCLPMQGTEDARFCPWVDPWVRVANRLQYSGQEGIHGQRSLAELIHRSESVNWHKHRLSQRTR